MSVHLFQWTETKPTTQIQEEKIIQSTREQIATIPKLENTDQELDEGQIEKMKQLENEFTGPTAEDQSAIPQRHTGTLEYSKLWS